jgi:hypothetical protein
VPSSPCPSTTAPAGESNGKPAPPTQRARRAPSGSSPTKRTLALLRAEGFTAAVVERWNPHAWVRQDLFGLFDLLAVHPDRPGVLGVQCTSTDHQAQRMAKALKVPALRTWLAAGNRAEIWGWKKSRRSGRWQVTRHPVEPDPGELAS